METSKVGMATVSITTAVPRALPAVMAGSRKTAGKNTPTLEAISATMASAPESQYASVKRRCCGLGWLMDVGTASTGANVARVGDAASVGGSVIILKLLHCCAGAATTSR